MTGVTESQWVVPLSDVVVDDELRAAVAEAVESGWWSMGPRVAAFEEAFASFCDARHAIAVANGTAALHLALLAAGCGEGDEVVLPSLNFVAAANAVRHTGARPIFWDIGGDGDLNGDPDDLERAITGATKAVIVLHYAGVPGDLESMLSIADRHGLVVIEDAAHAPGGSWRGRMCGTIGALGCFSFFANKNLPIGEGGMVVTDDDDLAEAVRRLRSHGMTTLTWDRHRGHAHAYDVVAQGFNYRLDELRAAMGLVQLARLEDGNQARRMLWARYGELLEGTEIALPFRDVPSDTVTAAHIAPVLLPSELDRTKLRESLASRGIQTSVHYPPIHRFRQYEQQNERQLPHTDDVAARLLTLPLYPHMGEAAVELVVETLLDAAASRVVDARAT